MIILFTKLKEWYKIIKKGEFFMKALDLAKYIVSKCYNERKPVSNLKLQKMLYFLYGWYYAEFHKSLFNDNFVAWKLGPVIQDVYFEYSKYIANPICESHDVQLDLNNQEIIFINEKIEELKFKSARDLVNESHDTIPWKNTFDSGAGKGNVIPARKIQQYFQR